MRSKEYVDWVRQGYLKGLIYEPEVAKMLVVDLETATSICRQWLRDQDRVHIPL